MCVFPAVNLSCNPVFIFVFQKNVFLSLILKSQIQELKFATMVNRKYWNYRDNHLFMTFIAQNVNFFITERIWTVKYFDKRFNFEVLRFLLRSSKDFSMLFLYFVNPFLLFFVLFTSHKYLFYSFNVFSLSCSSKPLSFFTVKVSKVK